MKVGLWKFDAALCALFALASAWTFWDAQAAAADAVRRYGRNVDSGVFEYVAVVIYLLPIAILFGIAALAGARQWRLGRYARGLAVILAVSPIVYVALIFVFK